MQQAEDSTGDHSTVVWDAVGGSDAKKKIERLDVGLLVKRDGIIGTGGFGRAGLMRLG